MWNLWQRRNCQNFERVEQPLHYSKPAPSDIYFPYGNVYPTISLPDFLDFFFAKTSAHRFLAIPKFSSLGVQVYFLGK